MEETGIDFKFIGAIGTELWMILERYVKDLHVSLPKSWK